MCQEAEASLFPKCGRFSPILSLCLFTRVRQEEWEPLVFYLNINKFSISVHILIVVKPT
jgi:hypothetical protein